MDRPETVLDIAFDHPLVSVVDELPRFPDRVLRSAPGPKSVRGRTEVRLKIGSSTSLAAIWTIRSRSAGMPSRLTFPDPRLGIVRSRTGSGA